MVSLLRFAPETIGRCRKSAVSGMFDVSLSNIPLNINDDDFSVHLDASVYRIPDGISGLLRAMRQPFSTDSIF